METEKVILDNGLTVYLLCDNTKHVTLANLIVNFGGIDSKYEFDGKIKRLKLSGIRYDAVCKLGY